MIAIYANRTHATRVAASVPRELPVEAANEWPPFERALSRSTCGVVVIELLHRGDDFGHLKSLKTRIPDHPLILVTREEPESLRMLKDVLVDEVVWLSELGTALCTAVQRACGQHLLSAIARRIQAAGHLSPVLRDALVLTCRNPTLATSVDTMAHLAGCDRRTLWRAWRTTGAAHCGVRLEDVPGWLLLLSALGMRPAGRCWTAIAWELGVSERRLFRLAGRLRGATLSRLAAEGQGVLAERFEREVLLHLVQPSGHNGANGYKSSVTCPSVHA